MKDRKERRRIRSCEHALASARDAQVGLTCWGLRRDFYGAIVAQTRGTMRVVGVQCLTCETIVPAGNGFLFLSPPAAGGTR